MLSVAQSVFDKTSFIRAFGTKYFTKFIDVEDRRGRVGITEYAAHHLGEIVFAELPEIETECAQDEVLCAVESVKAASDVVMPVGGVVTAVNTELEDHPSLINDDPYAGWMAEVKIADMDALQNLMTEKEYQAYKEECEH